MAATLPDTQMVIITNKTFQSQHLCLILVLPGVPGDGGDGGEV